MQEKKLIVLLKEGNENAFSLLYHKYWGKVYNFAKLYITSETEIEEIVQEVFIKLWDVRERMDENDSFKGFLFIITRNMIFNKSRKSFNESYYKASVLSAMEEASCHIEEEIVANDLKEYIDLLVKDLPPRQQEIFLLSREKGLSYKEIADKLNISSRTVEKHIYETLKYLKKNIHLLTLFLSL